MRRGVWRTLTVMTAAATLMAAGCGGSSTTTTPPTTPTPTSATETFTGTLNVNGGASFPFTVNGAGLITSTLAALTAPDGSTPDPAPSIGLSLGTWNGTSCQVVLANDNAFQGQQLIGQSTSSGNLCVRLSDVGKLTSPLAYTVTVVHP